MPAFRGFISDRGGGQVNTLHCGRNSGREDWGWKEKHLNPKWPYEDGVGVVAHGKSFLS